MADKDILDKETLNKRFWQVTAEISKYNAPGNRKFNGGCPGVEALEVRVRTSSIWRIAVVGAVKACHRDPEAHGMGGTGTEPCMRDDRDAAGR